MSKLAGDGPALPRFADRPAEGNAGAAVEFALAVRQLPIVPTLAMQLVRSAQREDISATELGRQIAADAGLASHLLRLVNSSLYGLSRRIGTVADALAVLGFNMVRRIVTAAVLQRPAQGRLPLTPATLEFWRHQLLTAALARWWHGNQGEGGEELAYMAGLLHDVGRLAMVARWPQQCDELLLAQDGLAIEQERRRFGFDHAQAGAALLRLWNVPEPIVLATACHADAGAPAEALAASVWQANRLAHRLAGEPDEAAEAPWMGEAGLTAQMRHRIEDEVGAFAGSRV